MICGGCDESDESDSLSRNEIDKFAGKRVEAFTGREGKEQGCMQREFQRQGGGRLGRWIQMQVARLHSLRMERWVDPILFQWCQGVNMQWELLA